MDIKSFIKDSAEREKSNHRIVNIMVVSLLALVIILTLCFGVKVNIGSAIYDDGKDAYVRQNVFKIMSVAAADNMSREDAIRYVEDTNVMLREKYGVNGFPAYNPFNAEKGGVFEDDGVFENLGKFDLLVKDLGKNASKVNLLKYKFAYAMAVSNPDSMAHKQSADGSRIYAMVGQLMLMLLAQIAFFVIAAAMMAFAIIALVKSKRNTKNKLTLVLLLIASAFNLILFSSSSFIRMNWAGYLMMILVVLCAICYGLIQHALMDKKDFSLTMCIHNAVLTGGGLLALIFFLSPLYKMTALSGASTSIGWGYLMDYTLTNTSYMFSSVMAYTLTEVLTIGLIMLPAVLISAFTLLNLSKLISADYQHNEKKIFLIVILALNALIFLLFTIFSGSGDLNITNEYLKVSINIVLVVFQLLTLVGMLVFEILYKVKPVKKELQIK